MGGIRVLSTPRSRASLTASTAREARETIGVLMDEVVNLPADMRREAFKELLDADQAARWLEGHANRAAEMFATAALIEKGRNESA